MADKHNSSKRDPLQRLLPFQKVLPGTLRAKLCLNERHKGHQPKTNKESIEIPRAKLRAKIYTRKKGGEKGGSRKMEKQGRTEGKE